MSNVNSDDLYNKLKSFHKSKDESHLTQRVDNKKSILGSGELEFLSKDSNLTIRCNVCSDRGFFVIEGKTQKCVSCDGYNILNEISEVSEFSIQRNLEKVNIPDLYIGREFKPSEIKSNESILKNLREDPMMDLYIRKLEILHNNISLGIKLDNSYILMAPQGYSKNHFVYCSMQKAIEKGYSVAPYLDTEELLELKIRKPEVFKEYLLSDLMFIKLLPAYISIDDTQMMKYIVDKRSRFGLPTVVTSRFNTSFLHGVELHLENNIGLVHVEKGDYSKLKEITGIYPNDYSNLLKRFEESIKKKRKLENDIRSGVSKIHSKGILSGTMFNVEFDNNKARLDLMNLHYDEIYSEKYLDYYSKNKIKN